MQFRYALAGAGLLLLSGCVAPTAVLEGYSDTVPAGGITLIDARPPEDKKAEWLSTFIGSCDNFIRRVGDEASVPTKMTLLRSDLQSALGTTFPGAVVTVQRYRIFLNMNAWIRAVNHGFGGLTADVFQGSACDREHTTGGWYAGSEVTNDEPPLIIEIGATTAGKDYSVRIVYSPKMQLEPGGFGAPDQAAEFFAALHRAHAALADQMRPH